MTLTKRPDRAAVGSLRRVRGWRHLVVVVLAATLLASCGSDEPSLEADRDAVRDGGTLQLAIESLPVTFNRWAAPIGDPAATVLAPTTGGAVLVADDGTWSVDERYASAVEIVGTDPFAVSVTLNPEAVWSDGTAIDVADMQAFAAAQIGAAGQQSAEVATWSVVAGVDPGADPWSYTVRFTRPTSDWPAFVYPGLPAEATAPEVYNAYQEVVPPSNGPFLVAEIDREAGVVRLERNPQWWGQAPALDAIEFRVLDGAQQLAAFTAGDLDVIDLAPSAAAGGPEGGTVSVAPGREWSHLTLNAARGPLASLPVRQAIAMAIDRAALVKATGPEAAVAGSFVTVPGQAGHVDTLGGVWERDVDQARALLASAGYVESGDQWVAPDGTPLTLRMPVPDGNDVALARAEAIADDLAEIGVTVTIEPRPVATFFAEVVVPLDFDLVSFLWSTDPLNTARVVARVLPVDSPLNFTGLADPGVDQAAQPLLTATDSASFDAAVAAFDTAVAATAVIIPLVVEPQVVAVRDDVVNIVAQRFASLDWTNVGFRA